jgi:hypothetical protein
MSYQSIDLSQYQVVCTMDNCIYILESYCNTRKYIIIDDVDPDNYSAYIFPFTELPNATSPAKIYYNSIKDVTNLTHFVGKKINLLKNDYFNLLIHNHDWYDSHACKNCGVVVVGYNFYLADCGVTATCGFYCPKCKIDVTDEVRLR